MFERLLVPIEDAEFAARAMDAGVALATQLGAGIAGLVADRPVPQPSKGAVATPQGEELPSVAELRCQERAQRLLARFEKRARRAGVPFSGRHRHTNDVDGEIARTALELQCDVIVMLTHDRDALGRLLFGSHTREVVQRTRLPVLVLHGALEAPRAFKHLLVPVDGSELASHAMRQGIDLARQLGASVTGLVPEPPTRAEPVLAEFARYAAASGVAFDGRQVSTQRNDEAIIECARETGCDMIVMATHGRGWFGRLLFGSSARPRRLHHRSRALDARARRRLHGV